jgi:hypothetical protein
MKSEASKGKKAKITAAETPLSQSLSLAFSPLTTPVIIIPIFFSSDTSPVLEKRGRGKGKSLRLFPFPFNLFLC